MGDLATLCAALGIDPTRIATERYRGPGERSDRKGWRRASLPYAHPDWRGSELVIGAGPTDDAALADLTGTLRAMVRRAAQDARRRAIELHRRASALRDEALACDARAESVDCDAARLEKVSNG